MYICIYIVQITVIHWFSMTLVICGFGFHRFFTLKIYLSIYRLHQISSNVHRWPPRFSLNKVCDSHVLLFRVQHCFLSLFVVHHAVHLKIKFHLFPVHEYFYAFEVSIISQKKKSRNTIFEEGIIQKYKSDIKLSEIGCM